MIGGLLLSAAILLSGVEGTRLRTRAFFDANNAKVGDPLVLTIDFIGQAEFRDLHPPALSRELNRKDWKLDDASAKTGTYRDARRLTYRVRPMREGVLWFPSLEFEYLTRDGEKCRVRSNDIPVHVKPQGEVVVAEMDEDREKMPEPPGLLTELPAALAANEDLAFAWRKACARPTADAFAAFDCPEAKMNEATCAIREGAWSRAMSVYRLLEWRIGQTPELERGIVAALAVRHENPAVELPVWRQVLRPVLRYGWQGRIALVFGGLAALALLLWLLGRGIRAVACLAAAVLLLPFGVSAQSAFQLMEEQMQRMQRQMQQSFGGFGFHFGEKEEREPIAVTASLALKEKSLRVGVPFELVLSLEAPKTASIGQIRIVPSETFGFKSTGPAQNLSDAASANPTNVIKRLSVPVRYDVPFKGELAFSVEGMVTGRGTRHGGRFSFSFSNSFRCDTNPVHIDIRPLSAAGQPDDFGGIISENLRVHELCDLLRVETNDVITITYRLVSSPSGYIPEDFLPKEAAYEWGRETDSAGLATAIEFRRYFVADGAPRTPVLEIPYYSPRTKSYKRAKTGGTALKYVPER